MDELREYLHKSDGQGWIAGALNGLSQAAFGKDARGVLGGFYRNAVKLFSSTDSGVASRPGYVPTPGQAAAARGESHPAARVDVTHDVASASDADLDKLAGVLMCGRTRARSVAARYPPVLSTDADDLLTRVVAIKQAVPMCDVSLIIERAPRAFLEPRTDDVAQAAAQRVLELTQALPGVDLSMLIHEDPMLLFDDIMDGVQAMRDMWPGIDDGGEGGWEDATAAAVASEGGASVAGMCLAIRALSKVGPPNRV
ncbi:unnamed protein product [Pedinophyceae sp. YPF-701]|nr:unnamed protein product [Pedinophyceae sp. YPF-701]